MLTCGPYLETAPTTPTAVANRNMIPIKNAVAAIKCCMPRILTAAEAGGEQPLVALPKL